MSAADIPVIDISNPDRANNAKELAEAMETIGFVYFGNISGYYDVEKERLLNGFSLYRLRRRCKFS